MPAPVGEPLARGLAQVAPAFMADRRRQVERNLRRVHGARLRRRRAAPARSTATFDSYGRYWLRAVPAPGDVAASGSSTHFDDRRASSTSTPALAAGNGVILALPHLGGWDFAGAWLARPGLRRHASSPSRSSRPSSSTGSSRHARALGMRGRSPLGPDGGRRGAARAARQPRRVPARATATSPATASRSSSSASAPRCPAARRRSRCARGAPLLPAAVLLPPRRRPRRRGSGRRSRSSARAASATTSRGSPRTLAHEFEDADPRRARALAPAAAELAERPRRRRCEPPGMR